MGWDGLDMDGVCYIFIYVFFDVTVVYSYKADLGRWGNGQMDGVFVVELWENG